MDVDAYLERYPLPSGRPSYQVLRAYLQKFIERAGDGDVTFTQGSAEILAEAAARRILDLAGRPARRRELETALRNLSVVVERLAAIGDEALSSRARQGLASGRINAQTIKELSKRHSFCGVRPYC